MNFKKLLSMIGMLTVVVPASMTVVACGSQTNNDATKENSIQKLLEKGIDGTQLGLLNTQKDALTLMQNIKGIKDIATLEFVNKEDATKPLKLGNNMLNIKITVGNISKITNKALITNISATDKEIALFIKRALAEGTDGSTLTTKSTQQNALNILTLELIANPNITLSFTDSKDAELHLVDGNNNLKLTIKVGEATETTNEALITNVNKNADLQVATEVKKLLETTGVDGSKLTTHNNQQDALEIMKKDATVTKDNAKLSFVTPNDATKPLNDDDNLLNINIQVGLETVTTKLAKVTKVVNFDNQKTANEIKTLLETTGVDGSKLTADENWQSALTVVQTAPGIAGKAVISFTNPDDYKNTLVAGTNTLKLTIKVGEVILTTEQAKITNVQNHDADIISAISKANYALLATDGDSAKSIKDQITTDFIKSPLSNTIKNFFDKSKFEFNDITVKSKSLTDQDLTKIGDTQALIIYKYDGKSGTANLTITVKVKYDDAAIQSELANVITDKNPLKISTKVSDDRSAAITDIANQLKDSDKSPINSFLKDQYKTEFSFSKLGVFTTDLYNSASASDKIADDFFSKTETKTAYVYIAYNETADASGHGIYVPITITIK